VGLPDKFVQDNLSSSTHGVLRGLHFQNPCQQGKLVYVLQGEVFDVAVDIRVDSPTFGHWTSCVLSGENLRQMYIPEGFAHGFYVTSEQALFVYKCTEYYSPAAEISIRWNDPDIGISWPAAAPALSAKDAAAPRLRDIPKERLPAWIDPATQV
jgi:dTDP-4-dehydrorhamnose 3,5-epimerase